MNFDLILLIIAFRYLRKTLQTEVLRPQIDQYLNIGFWFSLVLILCELLLNNSVEIVAWIAHIILFGLIYFCLTRDEFKSVKSFIYSILPFVVVDFLEDLTLLVNSAFHKAWANYFEIAVYFTIIWFIAMFFIGKKQRNDLEREQLKAAELEKEFQQSEALKQKLEIQVEERTSELLGQKEKLQNALNELRSAQKQLVQSEKMASLGELTAGIAHEIQNPLNFVNNFSEVSSELLDEMNVEIAKGNFVEVQHLVNDIKNNLEKIHFHGKRADNIIKDMLQHSRASSHQKEAGDINKLTDEYLRLAYHGFRAKDKSFNVTIIKEFDESIDQIMLIPQDIGRVILNLINNALYAVSEKKKSASGDYEPTVTIKTQKTSKDIEIIVKDNGNGIPKKVLDKIFQPFFTTKPTGYGTGLGLSLSYDIVKAHQGELKVKTKENEGSEFIICLKANTD